MIKSGRDLFEVLSSTFERDNIVHFRSWEELETVMNDHYIGVVEEVAASEDAEVAEIFAAVKHPFQMTWTEFSCYSSWATVKYGLSKADSRSRSKMA